MTKTGNIRVGVSGWRYPPWRGVFFPKGLRQKDELSFAASSFRSIEINGTFYRLQRPDSFARWHDETPDDFVFTVKAPRYITHVRRLKDIEAPMANFIASGLLRLGHKLGPILWQFPPRLKFDSALFDSFLTRLPQDSDQAIALGRRHDGFMQSRVWLQADKSRPLRHAIEIRNESFRSPAFIALLQHHRTALVCADTVQWPRMMDITADFVYCRLHGSEVLYASGYDDAALDAWAARAKAWASGREPEDAERVAKPAKLAPQGRDVFIFFDNDVKVRAPANAASLAARLGIEAASSSDITPARIDAPRR
jgi:uncharacterized protein YecE (DUF72 family)